MSIFQIVITIAILLMLVFVSRSRVVLFERVLFFIITLGGIILVLFPNLASRIAYLVGIGRGTDLVFYLFIVFSWFWFNSISNRIRSHERRLTKLTRIIAIKDPFYGESKSD